MASFDIVSEVNLQEVRNAIDQAARETATRYDFKGTDTRIELVGDDIVVESETEPRMKAAAGVLYERLARRDIDLKSVQAGEPEQVGGGRSRTTYRLNQGLDQDAAKEITKEIREIGLKVKPQIQGDRVRVTGKSRNDLQDVIGHLRGLDYRLPLQFINYRD